MKYPLGYKRALTSQEILSVENYLESKYGIAQSGLIVFEGDSMTTGLGLGNASQSYPRQTIALFGSGTWAGQNIAVSGQTVAQMTSDAATEVDPSYGTGRTFNVVSLLGGTNDLFFGADETTTYNRIVAYAQARRAAGFKVVVNTILPRSDTTTPAQFETRRQAVNTSLRANWSTFADALSDIAADSRIGDAGDETNATYYQDLVHMTQAGYAIVAEKVAAALHSIMTSTTTLTSSLNPSTFGSSVTLTASVIPSSATGTLTFKDGGTTIGTATLGHGSGSLTTSSLSVGSHSLTAVYGGNVNFLTSTSNTVSQTVDPSAPEPPTITSPVTGSLTNDNTPTVAGTGSTVGNTIRAYSGSTMLCTTTVNNDVSKSWTCNSTSVIDGVYTLHATEDDGDESDNSNSVVLTVDTASPSAPGTPDLQAASDTGSSSTDNITSDTTPTFTFSCESAATVTLLSGATTLGTGTCSSSTVDITSSGLAPQNYTIAARQTDPAGNQGSVSNGLSLTVDTAAPAAPGTPDLDAASDTGSSSTDNLTSDPTPTFTMSCESATSVTLLSGSTTLGTGTCASSTVSITSSALSTNGTYVIKARQTDAASNVSSDSSTLSITVDTSAPVLAEVTPVSSPTTDTTPNYTFKRTSDDSTVESIAADGGLVSISSNMVTIDPAAVLTATGYYVLIDSGSFQDGTGNVFAGISSTTEWSFTTSEAASSSSTSSSAEASSAAAGGGGGGRRGSLGRGGTTPALPTTGDSSSVSGPASFGLSADVMNLLMEMRDRLAARIERRILVRPSIAAMLRRILERLDARIAARLR